MPAMAQPAADRRHARIVLGLEHRAVHLVEVRHFLAARVGVGSLGAISAVTLRCVPLFTIRRVDEPRPLAETLRRFGELADSHDHFEFFFFPYGDTAMVRLSERSDRPPEPPGR